MAFRFTAMCRKACNAICTVMPTTSMAPNLSLARMAMNSPRPKNSKNSSTTHFFSMMNHPMSKRSEKMGKFRVFR